ncbi:prephenate dehydrogenase/arogenate dehydrogenase family protein [Bifidobacterium sp. 64T4]|uniref:prephenate dehydrogenase n=1 Tax=Bifidobacterium pongonis TaxID=2834432 RepID=UPI001C59584C|nr:prephenate dehydrogenase/arogenate dehydrogenase family protein [Bifidobacterium pongonis]
MVEQVGIVGLGLIGGSLARRLNDRGVEVTAWNHRPHPYAAARAEGIRCVDTLGELVASNPQVLVLCNPLKAMPAILNELAPLLASRPDITLTDVGSVKGMVRDQVEQAGLGERYVGAHPMAGNELSGWTAADPSLYDGALWAITVDANTAYERFLAVAELIVEDSGNRLIVLDDATHDRAAALISHMPHVVATSLINELVDNRDRNIAAALAAGSWRDMTRVALTDPNRTRAMVEEDKVNVEGLLRSMAQRLTAVADELRDGDADALGRFFADGQPFREYKAAKGRGGGELVIPESGWQQALLESARRGEAIIGFLDSHTVRLRVHAM